MPNKNKGQNKKELWTEAAKKYHLTQNQVMMAKKLGLNPNNFAKYAGNSGKKKTWKKPLSEFIEKMYMSKYPESPEAQQIINKQKNQRK